MVAPTGVNEGQPQEPTKAGRGGADLQDAQAAEEEPARPAPAEVAPTYAGPGGARPGEAKQAGQTPVEAVEKTVPAGAVPAQGGPAAAETDREPTGAKATAKAAVAEAKLTAPTEAELAEAERVAPAEAEAAEAELVTSTEAEPAEAELVEAGQGGVAEPGWEEAEEEEEKKRDVHPLAVAGIIFGVIALVGVAVGVLAVVTHGFRPKTVVSYRPAAAFGLRPGQCINLGANALDVTVLSCARPHDAEVFATFSLPATAWPGASAVQADATDGCANRFGSYLNPDLATVDLTQEFIYPNKSAWQAGERTVVCEVRATSGQLTGSVRAKS